MSTFLKIAAGVLIAALLTLMLSKQRKDISVLLVLAVCSMTFAVSMQYLEPVIALLQKLNTIANLDTGMLKILIKSVGIALLAEIVSLICADSGNVTLGKSIQVFAGVMVLYLSTPLFNKLIELIEDVLSAT